MARKDSRSDAVARLAIATLLAIWLNAPPALARDLPHRLHIEPTFEGGLRVQGIVAFIITRAGDW